MAYDFLHPVLKGPFLKLCPIVAGKAKKTINGKTRSIEKNLVGIQSMAPG